MRAVAIVAVVAALFGCQQDLGLEALRFACVSDDQCALGTRCLTGICAAGAPDADRPIVADSGCCTDASDALPCGDGRVDPGEFCDDGNRAGGDGCNSSCIVETGWTCTGTRSVCVLCGNGIVEADEECDAIGSGGCRDCKVGFGWTCTSTLGEPGTCTPKKFSAVSAGRNHTCGVLLDGTVYCEGSDIAADGTTGGQATVPADLIRATEIAAGGYHSCALRDTGFVRCWGDPTQGATGHGRGQSGVTISASSHNTCVLNSRGFAACWGLNDIGQSRPPADQMSLVSAGHFHSCGLRASDGSATCWGQNDGRLDAPQGPLRHIEVGYFHTCAVLNDGHVECWGRGVAGAGRLASPIGNDFVEVTAGHYHSCGRRADGSVACWAEVGIEHGQDRVPPGEFVDIDAGGYHTCGIRQDRSVECWGKSHQTRL